MTSAQKGVSVKSSASPQNQLFRAHSMGFHGFYNTKDFNVEDSAFEPSI